MICLSNGIELRFDKHGRSVKHFSSNKSNIGNIGNKRNKQTETNYFLDYARLIDFSKKRGSFKGLNREGVMEEHFSNFTQESIVTREYKLSLI